MSCDEAGVGDQALDLAVGTLLDLELVPVGGFIELRVQVRAPAVDGVEVIAGRTEVGGGVGIGLAGR